MFKHSTMEYFVNGPLYHINARIVLNLCHNCDSDMRRGADRRALSAEVFMDCGNIKPGTLNITLICNQKWKYYDKIVYLKKMHI